MRRAAEAALPTASFQAASTGRSVGRKADLQVGLGGGVVVTAVNLLVSVQSR